MIWSQDMENDMPRKPKEDNGSDKKKDKKGGKKDEVFPIEIVTQSKYKSTAKTASKKAVAKTASKKATKRSSKPKKPKL